MPTSGREKLSLLKGLFITNGKLGTLPLVFEDILHSVGFDLWCLVDENETNIRVAVAGLRERFFIGRSGSSPLFILPLLPSPSPFPHFLFPSPSHLRPLESEFLYSVLLWNNHLPIRYRHRQSGSAAYRLQARPAPTGPGLRLTAMPRPDLPFNGRHPRDPCNYMDHYSFTDPEGWKAELA